MSISRSSWFLCLSLLMLGGCDCAGNTGMDGGDAGLDGSTTGDTPPGSDGGGRCGNSEVEGAEECDDGNRVADDGCAPDCTLECGDGRVGGDEICDPGIAAGETGACPTSCDDGDDCTSDALDGSGCTVTCSNGPITAAMDDDMCCPPGEDASTDNDCDEVCGDGVVTGGELCDTAITVGDGSCPTDCNDGMTCTLDVLAGAGTCLAACSSTAITDPADGDGCCPPGATTATDDDCLPGCGNGVVDTGETCDTAIATGTGSCPTTCSDGVACTRDTLTGGGSCNAMCTFPTITAPMGGDGCCPPGANIGNDSDCAARCGDGVVTAPETCDDGNTAAGDGCSATCRLEAAPTTAFRLTDLDIVDPHLYAQIVLCVDVTNTAFGMDGVNPLLQNSIRMDGDSPPDGMLDLSIVGAFTPLAQAAGAASSMRVTFPDCTTPYTATMCTLATDGDRTANAAVTNRGGGMVCLGELGTTARAAITAPTAPAGGTCFSADVGTISINLSGIIIQLEGSSVGGEYFGTPATEIRDGLIRGFISYANARATIIPEGTTGQAAIDGEPLSSLLRTRSTSGAMAGACGSSNANSDLDMGPDGTTPGWWFYLRYAASLPVSYSEL